MLKIKTTNAKLLEPLQQVTGIVERRHTLPILSNVLISSAGSAVEWTARPDTLANRKTTSHC